MCPLLLEFRKSDFIDSKLCVSSQHLSMLTQVLDIFRITPDYDLSIMSEQQSLTTITSRVLERLEPILIEEQPDLVLIHGDTTTSIAAGLAAFYQQIPVGHVEAGLRTNNRYSPFPEEMNRTLISDVATYHFAPTKINGSVLSREGIMEGVFITGNTVIDAFEYTIKQDYVFTDTVFRNHDFDNPTILMTAHRRENIGEPLRNICLAILDICERNPQIRVLFPVHLNPVVQNTVYPLLGNHPQISLTDPVDILDMHNAIAKSYLVLTDSGGLQEEVPHLGKPVVVLRNNTERPEAVEAGTAMLAGTETESIIRAIETLIVDKDIYRKMSSAINPYGDGHASKRIRSIIENGFVQDESMVFNPR